jgi:hypothetical protein
MSLIDPILEAMTVMLRDRHGLPAERVTDWSDDTYVDNGGCETCGPYTTYEVSITYIDNSGNYGYYTYNGDFHTLIRELDAAS